VAAEGSALRALHNVNGRGPPVPDSFTTYCGCPGRAWVLPRSIVLLALLAVTPVGVGLIYARPARSEQPGLEADYCYPTRSAAVAAFGKGQTVIVEGQMTLERSGTVEVFEILGRSGDKAAVLLESQNEGGACILIQGRILGPQVSP
jgi:hypothetical protein